jgi:hypothetical protein
LSGIAAALWLLGLYAAAPALRSGERYVLADRWRDALILGAGIPFVLALVHALCPITCWTALAICIAVAVRRRGQGEVLPSASGDAVPYVTLGTLVAVAWPQLIRPLLDGDSLSYHLPNAASWAQSHSLWTTATHYWWYPPGSELFAAGIYDVASPFALPWCGCVALALLGFRIAAFARETLTAPPLLADALAAATIATYPLAIQGGTLQNDAWLAAFFLESLAALGTTGDRAVAMRTLAMTALIKPQGWVFAGIALVTRRAPREVWLAVAAVLGLWVTRDALLWNAAILAPASTAYGNIAGSTIAAHGGTALLLLLRVGASISPFALIALAGALIAPVLLPKQRALGWSAFAAALLFFALPFGYDTSVAQLATGASLRFAAPAVAAGALALAPIASRFSYASIALLGAAAIYGVVYVLGIFWNDGSTHAALPIAVAAVAITAAVRNRRPAWVPAAAFGVAVVATAYLAGRHPIDYYADSLRVGPVQPGIYRWIAMRHPPQIGGWGLRLGVVNVLSPATQTMDLPDAAPCAVARRYGVLLAAVAQNELPPELNTQRLNSARSCGAVAYEDPIAVVAHPSGAATTSRAQP